ncbi:GAF domain-containing protein [Conexibacter sp. CPCC 206217]|uniref:GAF domain-containing protein n=1 Tax=Conexibacter sp. CPCC 206217 TaxID=3064574 RepID=UPI002719427D|nr:GAF domain-containing protein [Conexibacter sp. CPCC 206217]MDO8213373.1 GAF domain-containing protein [Conexibacter sp. CPCC 206217]
MAIGSTVEPVSQARLIARARERVWEGGPPPRILRPVVLESWQRSAQAGVFAEREELPPLLTQEELEERRARHPLAAAMPLIRSLLVDVAEDARHVVAVCDVTGHLLWVEGSRATQRAAEGIGFVAGSDWSEGTTGTNAPGTALEADHPIQVFAAEHYHQTHASWMCAAAPIHDPEDGRLLGAVDLTGSFDTAHPSTLALANATARAVEAHLAALGAWRDAAALETARGQVGAGASLTVVSPGGRLLGDDLGRQRVPPPTEPGRLRIGRTVVEAEQLPSAPGYWVLRRQGGHSAPSPSKLSLRLLGTPADALVAGGRRLTVTKRQLEICALLALSPEGLGSGELRELLYGEQDVADVTIRSELSRLRRTLGPALAARPYRFAAPVATDVEHVERLLHGGDLAGAVQVYTGPLLPASESPRIVELRDQLHHELRAALLAGEDPEALYQWIGAPHGERDAPVARRLTALIDERDPRHATAVAVVEADLSSRR